VQERCCWHSAEASICLLVLNPMTEVEEVGSFCKSFILFHLSSDGLMVNFG